MVGREDLRQAIAFNAMMFNLARTIGPAIGGVIVAAIGESLCFLLNTVSSGAVLTSLFLMRVERRGERPTSKPWDDLKQGFIYITRHPHLRMVLFLSATCSCFGTSYLALMPAFAQDNLHRGADSLGYIISAFGAGAVSGAVLVSKLPERHLPLTPTIMAVILGGNGVRFGNAPYLLVADPLVVLTGFASFGLTDFRDTPEPSVGCRRRASMWNLGRDEQHEASTIAAAARAFSNARLRPDGQAATSVWLASTGAAWGR